MTNIPAHEIDPHSDRFVWILAGSLLIYGLIGLGVGVVKVKAPEPGSIEDLSPRMAKLIVAPKPPPPIPVPKPEELPPPEEVEPEEAVAEETEVASIPPLTPEEIAQKEKEKTVEIALNSGLLKLLKQSPPPGGPEEKLEKVFSETGEVRRKRSLPAGFGTGPATGGPTGIDDIMSNLKKTMPSPQGGIKPGETSSGGIDKVVAGLLVEPEETVLKERKKSVVEAPFEIQGPEKGKNFRTYESIAEVVKTYEGGVQFIYNKALRKNPRLRGTVTVEFTIAPNGEVLKCIITASTVDDPEFEKALIKRVLRWAFPKVPEGEVTITYPLIFSVAS